MQVGCSHLPLLVDKDNIKFSTTSTAKGVKMQPYVNCSGAGRDLVCQLFFKMACDACRSARRTEKNPVTAFIETAVFLSTIQLLEGCGICAVQSPLEACTD